MKNKIAKLFAIGILVASCVVTSCGKESGVTVKYNASTNTGKESVTAGTEEIAAAEEAIEGATEDQEASAAETVNPVFKKLSYYGFVFTSGVGAWNTNLNIDEYGNFEGSYMDIDMGDIGEGYEDGTMYYCAFSGRFSQPVKVDIDEYDEYAYEMKILEMSYEDDQIGREEIVDGMRYITSDAYGLTGTDTFLVYLSGTFIDVLSEEVMSWVRMGITSDDYTNIPIIVNVDQQEGFYGSRKVPALDEAQEIYDSDKADYDEAQKQYEASMTVTSMQASADKCYQIAKDCMDEIWVLICDNHEDLDFESIYDDQQNWLNEMYAEEATDGGGKDDAMASVDYTYTRASLTMERAAVLLDYMR